MKELDGKVIAQEICEQVTQKISELSRSVKLSIVVATNDPQAHWYVRHIQLSAKKCGVSVNVIELDPSSSTEQIAKAITVEAKNKATNGIILQTPLGPDVDINELLDLIPAKKDVDGASPVSAGRLAYRLPTFLPATAEAVFEILKYYGIDLAAKHLVVVGRSRVVGRPVVQLALQHDATVSICHSKTKDLASITKQADILVVAAGKANLIKDSFVKGDCIVIDVGTNVTSDNKLVGDVAAEVAAKVKAITPVPGGVGPVTTAIILRHTLLAAENS